MRNKRKKQLFLNKEIFQRMLFYPCMFIYLFLMGCGEKSTEHVKLGSHSVSKEQYGQIMSALSEFKVERKSKRKGDL